MKNILIAESDDNYLTMISSLVSNAGYNVLEANTHLNAHAIIRDNSPSLILLSWSLERIGGYNYLKAIKEDSDTSWIPIITLHENGDDISRVESLQLGAEDCLSKPIEPHELLLRINSSYRRRESSDLLTDGIISFNGLQLDTKSLRISANSKSTYLPAPDFKLLMAFLSSPDEVITRSALKQITSYKPETDDRTIDAHIMRLRKTLKKIGHQNIIQTVRGIGYRLSQDMI